MAKVNLSTRHSKPKLPEFDPTYDRRQRVPFPLFCHASGRFAKKIKGRFVYFGLWRGDKAITPAEAVAIYHAEKDEWYAGRNPRAKSAADAGADYVTLRELANEFLTAKTRQMEAGELSPRTFKDYQRCCKSLLAKFGKERRADDLTTGEFAAYRAALADRYAPDPLGREIQMVRTLFKWGYDAGHIDKPTRFGPDFKRPSKKSIRKNRQSRRDTKLFEPAEIRTLIDKATQPMRSMILLGINAGLGNQDIADLQRRHVDLKGGWMTYPRPKTAVERRAKLWPETIAALREAMADRPAPADDADADCFFLTTAGQRYARNIEDRDGDEIKITPIDATGQQFGKLCERADVRRRGYYSLRHTARTIGGGAADTEAINYVLGHEAPNDIGASTYRHDFDDSRLEAVAEHIRRWLFGDGACIDEAELV